VWVVGAQNAGKSSLINAMCGHKGGSKARNAPLTAAPLPGTTIGCVELPEVLPSPHRAFDTPGIIQPQQLTTRLFPEELRMVLPRRPLKPRTYRLPAGGTVHIGALARVDVLQSPASTMYLTVWTSSDVVCHFGKMEKAEALYEQHAGKLLQPPTGDAQRLAELGEWVPHEVRAFGESWRYSSQDVTLAGVGWIGVSCVGEARLQVWTYPGVGVTLRDAIVPDMAKEWESPGWSSEVSAKGKTQEKTKGKYGGGKTSNTSRNKGRRKQ